MENRKISVTKRRSFTVIQKVKQRRNTPAHQRLERFCRESILTDMHLCTFQRMFSKA